MSGLGMGVQALKLAPREQAKRFAAAVCASVVAVILILPFGGMHNTPHSSEVYIRIALLPAAAAWFIVWQSPGSPAVAMFRTVMLSIALVGVGGLALLAVAGMTAPWMEETIRSPQFIPQALVYVGIGVLGVLAPSLFENK